MGKIVFLAFLASLYPTLLGAVLVILTRPGPARLLVSFLAGGMGISITIGVVLVLTLQDSSALNTSKQSASPAIDLVIGAFALLLMWVALTRRDEPLTRRIQARRQAHQTERTRPGWTQRTLTEGSAGITFVVGIVLNLPSVWYLAALGDIVDGSYSTVAAVLLVLLFNLIMFLLAEVPLAAYLVAPGRAQSDVERFNAYIKRNVRTILVVIAGAVAAYMLIRGTVYLLT